MHKWESNNVTNGIINSLFYSNYWVVTIGNCTCTQVIGLTNSQIVGLYKLFGSAINDFTWICNTQQIEEKIVTL